MTFWSYSISAIGTCTCKNSHFIVEPNTLFILGGKVEIFSGILEMPLAFYVRREEKWFILKKKLSCDSFFLLNSAKITAIHSLVIFFTLSEFSGNLSKLIIPFNENLIVLNCSKRVLNLVKMFRCILAGVTVLEYHDLDLERPYVDNI